MAWVGTFGHGMDFLFGLHWPCPDTLFVALFCGDFIGIAVREV